MNTLSNVEPTRGAAHTDEWMTLGDMPVRINDRENFHVLRKDIFERRIYAFDCDRLDPSVLDCGSNIGVSVLFFKRMYPGARVIAFEPDPSILPYLTDNVAANNLTDVTIVEAALAPRTGRETLLSDGKYASTLAMDSRAANSNKGTELKVPCVRLRDYLDEPVDFLKMNIEGLEWDVLADSEDRLRRIRSMTVEYHHLPHLPRTLHRILDLLDRCGYDYLIHDFDAVTNPHCQPPFRLRPATQYYLLIHATRRD